MHEPQSGDHRSNREIRDREKETHAADKISLELVEKKHERDGRTFVVFMQGVVEAKLKINYNKY